MEQLPTPQTVERIRVKPRVLVFDDSVEQLASYCIKLRHTYDVEGVLVPSNERHYAAVQTALAQNDCTQAEHVRAQASAFGQVRHVVGNQAELHALLKARKPDFVLSDYQMRQTDGPLMGIDVMHAVAELLPNAGRAVHTGSGCAMPDSKVSDLSAHEFEDRMKLVKAMREDGFKVFAKSPYHHNFDPKPIEAYFTQSAAARTIS